jgi:ribonuclease P protein component
MQKQYRLKRRSTFSYVYKKGDKSSARHLLLLSVKSRSGLKIGISVSKKVGGAVTRNRVKRLIREGINCIFPQIVTGYTYVIVAKSSSSTADYHEICAEVKDVFEKAGKLC